MPINVGMDKTELRVDAIIRENRRAAVLNIAVVFYVETMPWRGLYMAKDITKYVLDGFHTS